MTSKVEVLTGHVRELESERDTLWDLLQTTEEALVILTDHSHKRITMLERKLSETILLWRSGENPNDYPEHAILDGGPE